MWCRRIENGLGDDKNSWLGISLLFRTLQYKKDYASQRYYSEDDAIEKTETDENDVLNENRIIVPQYVL